MLLAHKEIVRGLGLHDCQDGGIVQLASDAGVVHLDQFLVKRYREHRRLRWPEIVLDGVGLSRADDKSQRHHGRQDESQNQ